LQKLPHKEYEERRGFISDKLEKLEVTIEIEEDKKCQILEEIIFYFGIVIKMRGRLGKERGRCCLIRLAQHHFWNLPFPPRYG
jgi:hypothetical protein